MSTIKLVVCHLQYKKGEKRKQRIEKKSLKSGDFDVDRTALARHLNHTLVRNTSDRGKIPPGPGQRGEKRERVGGSLGIKSQKLLQCMYYHRQPLHLDTPPHDVTILFVARLQVGASSDVELGSGNVD